MLRGGKMDDASSSVFYGRFIYRLFVDHHSQTLVFLTNTGMKTQANSLAVEADLQNQSNCLPN